MVWLDLKSIKWLIPSLERHGEKKRERMVWLDLKSIKWLMPSLERHGEKKNIYIILLVSALGNQNVGKNWTRLSRESQLFFISLSLVNLNIKEA